MTICEDCAIETSAAESWLVEHEVGLDPGEECARCGKAEPLPSPGFRASDISISGGAKKRFKKRAVSHLKKSKEQINSEYGRRQAIYELGSREPVDVSLDWKADGKVVADDIVSELSSGVADNLPEENQRLEQIDIVQKGLEEVTMFLKNAIMSLRKVGSRNEDIDIYAGEDAWDYLGGDYLEAKPKEEDVIYTLCYRGMRIHRNEKIKETVLRVMDHEKAKSRPDAVKSIDIDQL